MLFNSYQFLLVFLPLVLFGFGALSRWEARRPMIGFLVAASLLFYGWWSWHYLALIAFSVGFNYAWAEGVRRLAALPGSGGRAASSGFLVAGVAVNLGLLGYFKYTGFVVETVNRVTGTTWPLPRIVLPLALSFVTFEQIIYLVETGRDPARRYDFLEYCLYVTFFPRLIAGPIVRPRELFPQLRDPDAFRFSASSLGTGLFIFAVGLFKKTVLADTFAPWADRIFDGAASPQFFDAWGGALAFTLQIYFDFSGYTDMAIGLARMLNIGLPENFDSPYQARSMIDFWRRWHITLSTFFRDYVYVPLARSRLGGAYLALLLTMLLVGLWHGAGWMFLVWGAFNGGLLILNTRWRRTGIVIPEGMAWALTFFATVVGFTLFRSGSLARAEDILAGLAGLHGFAWKPALYSFGRHEWKRLLPALALVLWCPSRQVVMQRSWSSDWAYAAAFGFLAGLSFLRLGNPVPFVYFQF